MATPATTASLDDIVELNLDEIEHVSGGVTPILYAAGIVALKLINIGVTVYRLHNR